MFEFDVESNCEPVLGEQHSTYGPCIIGWTMPDTDSVLLPPLPNPNASDHFASLIRAGGSAIPLFSGPAVEIFGMITAPLLGRRREQWFENLRLKIDDLSTTVDGLTVESLAQNEEFISVLVQATQAAFATNKQGKLDALRNVVLNVAVGRSPALDK